MYERRGLAIEIWVLGLKKPFLSCLYEEDTVLSIRTVLFLNCKIAILANFERQTFDSC